MTSDYLQSKWFTRITYTFLIVCIISLAVAEYAYPLRNSVPPGVDASIYINDVRWITNNNVLPHPYQTVTHGSAAYPSPGTDILLSALTFISKQPIQFSVFNWYQETLIVLLFLTSYLVGTMFNKRVAIFYVISLLASYSITRLYIGSTVSNLMAFSIVNIIVYLTYKASLIRRKLALIICLIMLFFTLFLVHGYLTAPLFVPVFVIYLALLYSIKPEFRNYVRLKIINSGAITKIVAVITFVALGIFLVTLARQLVSEAVTAFTNGIADNKFQNIILFSQYGDYVGRTLWVFSLLGIGAYMLSFKKNVLSYRVLPFLWVLVLWGLMQMYHLGVNFYYERLILLAGIFLALFAAIFFDWLLRNSRIPSFFVRSLLATSVVIVFITAGTGRVVSLFSSSNLLKSDQLTALRLLGTYIKPGEVVISNVNGISQTAHDVIVSNADITYSHTQNKLCAPPDNQCQAFTSPGNSTSALYFKEHDIQYFLLMLPSVEGNSNAVILAKKYLEAGYKTLATGKDVWLFTLPTWVTSVNRS